MTDIVDTAGLDRAEYNLGVEACKNDGEIGLINSDSFIIGFARQNEKEQQEKGVGVNGQ